MGQLIRRMNPWHPETPLRTVERDITRSRKLGPDLDRVAGTSLDKGAELDALAMLSAADRAPSIQTPGASFNSSCVVVS